jgi:hypothetical protein
LGKNRRPTGWELVKPFTLKMEMWVYLMKCKIIPKKMQPYEFMELVAKRVLDNQLIEFPEEALANSINRKIRQYNSAKRNLKLGPHFERNC